MSSGRSIIVLCWSDGVDLSWSWDYLLSSGFSILLCDQLVIVLIHDSPLLCWSGCWPVIFFLLCL